MQKLHYYSDVNLVEFKLVGSALHFEFLDMFDGETIAIFICDDIQLLSYSDLMIESLPLYIGEVNVNYSERDQAYEVTMAGWADVLICCKQLTAHKK